MDSQRDTCRNREMLRDGMHDVRNPKRVLHRAESIFRDLAHRIGIAVSVGE